jgi:hypothetical protein
MRIQHIALFATLLLLPKMASSEPVASETARRIPLDTIYAYDMPGTLDVLQLEPKQKPNLSNEEFIQSSSIQQILNRFSFRNWPKDGRQAEPAIIVEGIGKQALENAAKKLKEMSGVERRDARQLTANRDYSVLFFSYMSPRFVHLISVDQTKNEKPQGMIETEIKIKYRFVSHMTDQMTTHFALVPIESLQPGVVRIVVEQLPPVDADGKPDTPFPNARKYVCESTSFRVK